MDATKTLSKLPVRRAKQQRTIETRSKIFRAALSEFALFGFDGASTRRIAETAEVPHSLVLYHFKSKANLWDETVDESVRRYTQSGTGLWSASLDRGPADQLKDHFRHYIQFSAEFPDFFRMLTHENMVQSDRLKVLIDRHTGPNLIRTTELIRRLQNGGQFVEGDPVSLMYMFLGAATAPYRSAREIELLTGKRPDTKTAIEQHIKMIERLFFRDAVDK